MSSYSKVAQDPLIRAIRHDKDVPGHEERLLVAWDEEEPGEYTRRMRLTCQQAKVES